MIDPSAKKREKDMWGKGPESRALSTAGKLLMAELSTTVPCHPRFQQRMDVSGFVRQ
jgi:hypothetical protein